MMNADEFFADYITHEEGGLSLDPVDAGNWYDPNATVQRPGRGALIGSNRGVTGAAYAEFRGSKVVTAADIAGITLAVAAAIARKLFYEGPGFDRLPWDPVVASAIDFGWGAGASHGVKLIQRICGAADDGQIGPATVASYKGYLTRYGLEHAGVAIEQARNIYYDAIIARIPADAKYRNGWRNRSHYFAPGGDWWGRFLHA